MNKLWCLTFIFPLLLASCDFKSSDSYLNTAYELEKKGKHSEAIPFLNEVLKRNPNYRPALFNRAADKSMIGDFEGAILDYKKILESDPDNTEVLMHIGSNFRDLKKFQIAVNYYNEALKSKGALPSDSLFISINWHGENDRDEDYYVRAYEIKKERGLAYYYLDKCELAIQDLKEGVEYGHSSEINTNWLSNAYLKCGDTIQAIKYSNISYNYSIYNKDRLTD